MKIDYNSIKDSGKSLALAGLLGVLGSGNVNAESSAENTKNLCDAAEVVFLFPTNIFGTCADARARVRDEEREKREMRDKDLINKNENSIEVTVCNDDKSYCTTRSLQRWDDVDYRGNKYGIMKISANYVKLAPWNGKLYDGVNTIDVQIKDLDMFKE